MEQNNQNYTCPMHPEIVQKGPGDCPKCGMKFILVNADIQLSVPSQKHLRIEIQNKYEQGSYTMRISDRAMGEITLNTCGKQHKNY